MKEIKSLPITQWSLDDRPREKLLLKGNLALSDAELLAILLGSGSRNESAVDLAKRILQDSGQNISKLAKRTITELQEYKGVGQAKAVTIAAALELGRRRRLESAMEVPKITSSKSVFELMQPVLGDLQHEEFWVVYLNNSNKVILKAQMSRGGLTGTLVDTRLIYKKAIEVGATGIILCHNHPSEKLTPSQSDRNITNKIKEGGKVMDIAVLDHLIITEKAYFSFADEGMM